MNSPGSSVYSRLNLSVSSGLRFCLNLNCAMVVYFRILHKSFPFSSRDCIIDVSSEMTYCCFSSKCLQAYQKYKLISQKVFSLTREDTVPSQRTSRRHRHYGAFSSKVYLKTRTHKHIYIYIHTHTRIYTHTYVYLLCYWLVIAYLLALLRLVTRQF